MIDVPVPTIALPSALTCETSDENEPDIVGMGVMPWARVQRKGVAPPDSPATTVPSALTAVAAESLWPGRKPRPVKV
jgi:hypothetical protein